MMILGLSISLSGCREDEKDTEVLYWAYSVDWVDLSGLGAEAEGGVYFEKTVYKADPGKGLVFWNVSGGGLWVESVYLEPEVLTELVFEPGTVSK